MYSVLKSRLFCLFSFYLFLYYKVCFCFYFVYFFSCTARHLESYFSDRGLNLHWEHGFLTLDHQGRPCFCNKKFFNCDKI